MVIEPLDTRHDRAAFDCGLAPLNEFLQKTARQHAVRHAGVTHVAVEEVGATRILGFVSLSMKPVNRASLPNARKLPGGEYTVAFIGQLATDKEFQRRGIGERLLSFAQFQALRVSAVFGLVGVALDLILVDGEDPAVTQRRCKFYTDRQFEPLVDDATRLYKSIEAIRAMELAPQ
ncbi:MAG: GNAT family N-acetyltransferase [Armatimonadota bacterium]|nr:GNAT family N-acetyltransferase [Armatimonadota bacterium]